MRLRTIDGGRAVLVVVATALLLRLLALGAASDAGLVLDEQLYVARAEALLDGDGFVGSYQSWVRHPRARSMAALPQYPGAYQPPGYTVFLAGILGVTGRSVLAVKLAQAVLGALTIWLVYAIGRRWMDPSHGLLAAWICALYPTLIAFTHYIWTETLFIFLLLTGVWLLTRGAGLPDARAAAFAGAVFGLAALTRGVMLYYLPVVCLWLVWAYRRRWRSALSSSAWMLAAALLVILPWSLRNTLTHGGIVLIDTNGPFNVWRGNAPDSFGQRPAPPRFSYAAPFESLPLMPVGPQDQRAFVETVKRELDSVSPTDLQITRSGRALARRHILSDPGLFVRRAWTKTVDLWNPTSFLMRQFRLGAYGTVHPITETTLSWMAVVSYVLVMVFAVEGAVTTRRDRHTQLVMLLVVMTTAASILTFGLTRFRLPVVPFLALLAAHGMFALSARLGWSRIVGAETSV
jgi:4-amino-4-deoxy-L-arabinose transferase-like glycosyltransferase